MRNEGSLSERFGGVVFYFVAKFEDPFESYGVWQNENILENQTSIVDKLIGAYVSFPSSSSSIQVEFLILVFLFNIILLFF